MTGPRRRVAIALGVAASLLVASGPVWAKGSGAKRAPSPPPKVTSAPEQPKKPTSGDPTKPPTPKKQGDPRVPDPPPSDAGKTATSRAKYLVWLLLESARAERSAVLGAAQDEGIDAALAKLPPGSPAKLRESIDEGRRLVAMSKWGEALAAAESALEIDVGSLPAHLLAARALSAADRDEDALHDHLSDAVAAPGAEALVRHARGIVRWTGGAGADATRRDLAGALALEPADGRFALTLGTFDVERKAYHDATGSLLAATDARARDLGAWRTLARALALSEDWAGAVAALERVIRLTDPPADAAAPAVVALRGEHLLLALLYADRLEDREKARSHAQAFVSEGGVDLALGDWLDGLVAK